MRHGQTSAHYRNFQPEAAKIIHSRPAILRNCDGSSRALSVAPPVSISSERFRGELASIKQ